MLASGSAWRVLEAEHDELRQLLDAILRSVDDAGWASPGPGLDALRERIREFQAFEADTHRPKGVVLLGSVRGRSPEADRLLDEIEDEHRSCEELLAKAADMFRDLHSGGAPDPAAIALLLRRHRELMLVQLEQEDTRLRSYTSQLLTSQEWSDVVSAMSEEVRRVKRRRAATKRQAPQ